MDVTVRRYALPFVLALVFACRVAVRLTDEQREELSRSESCKRPSARGSFVSPVCVI